MAYNLYLKVTVHVLPDLWLTHDGNYSGMRSRDMFGRLRLRLRLRVKLFGGSGSGSGSGQNVPAPAAPAPAPAPMLKSSYEP